MDDATITAQVAYALPDQQLVVNVDIAHSATLKQAIEASGLLERFPDIDLQQQKTGIFGQLASLEHPLQPGDRVEIYRPLQQDPMTARRQRTQKK